MKIIGIELRLQFHDPQKGPIQKEFAIVPCDVVLLLQKPEAGYYSGNPNITGTLHTDCGDLGFQLAVPDMFLDPEYNKSRFAAKQTL